MCKRVGRKKRRVATTRANALLKSVRNEVRSKYKFTCKLVGSGSWNTIVEDKKGHYDLDYQIILTHNSKVYKKDKEFKDPTEINSDFLKAFNKFKVKGEIFQDSTSAITLVNKNGQPYSIDFVIIDGTPEPGKNYSGTLIPRQIIRRNIKKETPSKDEKTWNDLRDVPHAYYYFDSLDSKDKEYIIEEMVIPAKVKEKSKDGSKEEVRSSYEVFIGEITKHEKGNKKKDH